MKHVIETTGDSFGKGDIATVPVARVEGSIAIYGKNGPYEVVRAERHHTRVISDRIRNRL